MKYALHYAATVLIGAVAAACGPIQTRNTVVIEQPKPLEVNVNLSGRLELVITDARQDLEKINGAAPARQVTPQDIGLPPDADTIPDPATPAAVTTPTPAPAPSPARPAPPARPTTHPAALLPTAADQSVALLAVYSPAPGHPQPFAAASEEDLIGSMKSRHRQINQLWLSKLVGEAHTGLLVAKAPLNAQQSALVDAENNDRRQLYALRAAKNKTTEAAAALAYYLQRLGYAQNGEWVEKYNKQSKAWEWEQWGQ